METRRFYQEQNRMVADVEWLQVWKDNPRAISEKDFDQLKKDVQGEQFKPLLITEEGVVLGGNMRLRAYKDLGIQKVWVSVVSFREDEEKKVVAYVNGKQDHRFASKYDAMVHYSIKDNEARGFYQEELLAEQLSKVALPLESYKLTMVDGVNLSEILKKYSPEEDVVEDEPPEVSQEPAISKLGEVYQLGRHRLMCGDSTKIEDVEKLMNGHKADMVFTDPPYGMKKEKEGVLNDNLNYEDLLKFNKEWIPLSFAVLKDNGSWYCWGTDEPLMDIYSNILKPYIKENKATFRNLITWNKSYLKNGNTFNPFGASGSEELRSYPVADEKCLFVMCGVQGFSTNADNYYEAWEPVRLYLLGEKEKMGWSDKYIAEQLGIDPRLHWFSKSQWEIPTEEKYKELQKLSGYNAFKKDYNEIKKDYYLTRAYFENADKSNNVWNIEITKGEEKRDSEGHATPKPLALCQRAIKSSSRENEIVLDLFGGSGSTLIACEQLNRTCYMMEIDPKYCDVIRKRYAKFIEKEEDWENTTPKV